MSNIIAGPGQTLPMPQALYPASLYTTPFTAPTNQVGLQAGQELLIPAGTWIVSGGSMNPVTAVQWKNPVTGQWLALAPAGAPYALTVRSDGFNFRVANTSGGVTGATVATPGTGYQQATTQVTPSAGTSKWQAIVGGALGAVTISNGGSGYAIPPFVMVPAPPAPGIPAVGIAVLTAGAVTGVTWLQAGAGYTMPPKIVFATAPNDTGSGAAGTIGALAGAGTVTAVVLVDAGTPAASLPTLTITGQGTGAAATVLPATEVTAANDVVTIQPASGI